MILPGAEAVWDKYDPACPTRDKTWRSQPDPKQNRDLQRTVFERHFIGRAGRVTGLDQLQITKDAIDHEWDGEHHAVVFRQVGRGEGVKRICDDGHA